MVNPPQPGDDCYELYETEMREHFESLQRRAMALTETLNQMDGVTCNNADGRGERSK